MKILFITLALLFPSILFSQDDCIPLLCHDDIWLEGHVQKMLTEIQDAPTLGIGVCNSGSIQQCFFRGQAVYTHYESTYLCDLPISVVDCKGDELFKYGGFCFPAPLCPGFLESQELEDCVLLFSTFETDNSFCEKDVSIPTLGEWALICLAFLLLITAINSMKGSQRIHQLIFNNS